MDTTLTRNKGFGRNQRFHRQHRLAKHDVISLLRDGARLNRASIGLKLAENRFGNGRIAIAVPKRILKTAVARNRVKRTIREGFRRHAVRTLPVDMLVTFESKARAGDRRAAQGELRDTLTALFGEVSRRFGAVDSGARPQK